MTFYYLLVNVVKAIYNLKASVYLLGVDTTFFLGIKDFLFLGTALR